MHQQANLAGESGIPAGSDGWEKNWQRLPSRLFVVCCSMVARMIARALLPRKGFPMSIWLVMQATDGRERRFAVKSNTVIGRETTCDVRVPVPTVGLKHCQLLINGDELKLIDLHSSERGTFHNGNRVEQAVLANEDKVTVGPVTFTVRVDDGCDGASPEVVIERLDGLAAHNGHSKEAARLP
jgi:hypothetical protein